MNILLSSAVHYLALIFFITENSLLGAFAKLRKATVSFVMSVFLSVCPHGIIRLPLEGFSLNSIFEYFSENHRENSSFIESDKNKGYYTVYITSRSVILRTKSVSDKRSR